MKKNKLNSGYTLVELMIVVTIVAVLGAIAYPNYIEHVQKSKRADAKDTLLSMAARQERWFLQNQRYSGDIDSLGGNLSPEEYYTMSVATTDCDGGDGTACFTITATARDTQANDLDCARFTLDNYGRKAAFNSGGGADSDDLCW